MCSELKTNSYTLHYYGYTHYITMEVLKPVPYHLVGESMKSLILTLVLQKRLQFGFECVRMSFFLKGIRFYYKLIYIYREGFLETFLYIHLYSYL